MIFLNSVFLWGIAFIALPILIHIIQFQRPRKVLFPNVDLLMDIEQSVRSRNRIRDWLILLFRILFIVCLALAFARPIRPGISSANIQNYSAIFMDNSYSMQAEGEKLSLLDEASQAVQGLISAFSGSERVALTDHSFKSSQRFQDKIKIEEQISGIRYFPSSRTAESIWAKQRELFSLENQSGGKMFWFSDFQKSQWKSLEKLRPDDNFKLHLIPIQGEESPNVRVDSVFMDVPYVQLLQKNALKVRFKNYGTQTAEQIPYRLFIGNQQAASGTLTLSALEERIELLDFIPSEKGIQACRVEVEDEPYSFDNVFHFSMDVAPAIRMLCVSADQAASRVSKVFEGEELVRLQNMNVKNFDPSALKAFQIVILEDIDQLPTAWVPSLKEFVKSQGTLVLFPSSKFPAEDLQNLGISANKQPERTSSLEVPDISNPFFSGVFDKVDRSMNTPSPSSSLQLIGGMPLLKFRNGSSYLSQYTNNGQIYVFSGPTGSHADAFSRHALFVPTLYKIAISSKTGADRMYYSLDENYAFYQIDSIGAEDLIEIQKVGLERETSFVPIQRIIGGKWGMEIQKELIDPGTYLLYSRRAKKQVGMLSFNVSSSESYTETYSREELMDLFKEVSTVSVASNSAADALATSFKEEYVAREYYKYFIFAALFCVLIEILLLLLSSKSKKMKASSTTNS